MNPAPGAPLTTRAQALQQVFNWFFAQGCPDLTTCRLPLGYANIPGLTTLIRDSLSVPVHDRVRGDRLRQRRIVVRVPGRPREARGSRLLQHRDQRIDRQGQDEFGNKFDIGYINNSNSVERNYTGLHTSLSYRTGGFNGGVNWTWSHTLGNLNGETAASGPVPNASETYPEYKDPAWNNPYGSLATDERHR